MSDLELTKKAEAYVAAAGPSSNLEEGVLTLQIDRTSRKSLAGSIEALIDMLDDLSPDCDLEDTADDEPSLGWGGNGGLPTVSWPQDGRGGSCDDREFECEDEGAQVDDEHDLGWQDEGSQERMSWGQWEAELGSTEEIDQVRRLETSADWLCHDGEPELGWGENAGKGFQPGDTMDDREGDDEREYDHAEHGVVDLCEDLTFSEWAGDGSGNVIAKKMLRERVRRTKFGFRTCSSGEIVREINPMVVPQIDPKKFDPDNLDAKAHYWAAKGFG